MYQCRGLHLCISAGVTSMYQCRGYIHVPVLGLHPCTSAGVTSMYQCRGLHLCTSAGVTSMYQCRGYIYVPVLGVTSMYQCWGLHAPFIITCILLSGFAFELQGVCPLEGGGCGLPAEVRCIIRCPQQYSDVVQAHPSCM